MIEQLKAALEKVKSRRFLTSVGIEAYRDPEGNIAVQFTGYQCESGSINRRSLDEVVKELNAYDPIAAKIAKAAKLREEAGALEAEAAKLEQEAGKVGGRMKEAA